MSNARQMSTGIAHQEGSVFQGANANFRVLGVEVELAT